MRTIFHASLAALTLLTIPVGAKAADLSVRPRAVPATAYIPTPFSWTGFYIGGNLGGAWADGNVSDSLFGLNDGTRRSGFIGGGQAGLNYQFSNLVLGVEGDADWTSLGATGNSVFVPGVGTLQASADTKWVSTLAARFGVAYDRVLFYGKAGGGWVGNRATVTNLSTGSSASISNTNNGWLLGAGIEWAFAPNLSTKVEYDYIGLRGATFTSAAFPADTFTLNRNIQMVKIGLNYKFGWDGPVTARY